MQTLSKTTTKAPAASKATTRNASVEPSSDPGLVKITLKIRDVTFRELRRHKLHGDASGIGLIVRHYIHDAIHRTRVAIGDIPRREFDPVESLKDLRNDYRKIEMATANARVQGEAMTQVTFEMGAENWTASLSWIRFIGVEPFQFIRAALEAKADELADETYQQVWLTTQDADLWSRLSMKSSKILSRFGGDLLVKASTLPKSKQAKARPLASSDGDRWPVRFTRAELATIKSAAVKCDMPLDVWIYSNLIAGLTAMEKGTAA